MHVICSLTKYLCREYASEMNTYKVIFAKNTIVSCTLVNNSIRITGRYICEQVNGKPIYALIQADSEEEATSIADQILSDIAEKTYGKDYIF